MIKILHLLVKWFHNNSLQQISHYFSLSQSLKILFSDVKSDGKQNYCDKFLLCKILRLVIIDRHHILTPPFPPIQKYKCNQERKQLPGLQESYPCLLIRLTEKSIPKRYVE